VLLVEDNADMRAYLTRLLRSDGWNVTAVAAAAAALRLPPTPAGPDTDRRDAVGYRRPGTSPHAAPAADHRPCILMYGFMIGNDESFTLLRETGERLNRKLGDRGGRAPRRVADVSSSARSPAMRRSSP
jgi:CheY-like chemotaxis protein